jgi:hypothetical protein
MSFFDKKQEVIDIKLTQFGKGLLARGFFKPVYYRFFDDDILYNSECAGFTEAQNRSEERIFETQKLKTQHLTVGVETSFDQNQNQINSGSLRTFMEISRRQDPFITDRMLKYPLENSLINSQEAPQILLGIHGVKSDSNSSTTEVKGIELPVPQLNMTASFRLTRNAVNQIPEEEIPKMLVDSESYIDLSKQKIDFLDNTFLMLYREDIVIDIEELGVDFGLDNFEVEIFEVTEEGEEQNLTRLETREELSKYFDIKTDSMVDAVTSRSLRGHPKPRGRN